MADLNLGPTGGTNPDAAQRKIIRGKLAATNEQTPVLASKSTAGGVLYITSSDTNSGINSLEDYNLGTHSFIYRPLGVSELAYDDGSYIGNVYFWFAGLPNCNSLLIGSNNSWDDFYAFDAENVLYLNFASSTKSGTFTVPSSFTGLYSLDFSNNTQISGTTFTAGAHPELAVLNYSNCSGFNTAGVDALLVSLEAANTSTMVGATYTGNGQGTELSSTNYSNTNVNITFTRTTANLAQLVVQPTLTLSYLTTTDGPIGLTITTSTGAITAKTVFAYPIPASAIVFSTYPYQTKTLSLSSYTFTQSGATNGKIVKLYLTQTYVGALTVNWFITITWSGGIVPTYSQGTTTIVTLTATGTNTFNGSFTTAGSVITTTTGTELITGMNANANVAALVTTSSGGTNTGAVGNLSSTKLGNLTISKLIARGWSINLSDE